MDPNRCVPLRDSYEVFGPLKATTLSVNGEIGYRVVDNPDIYKGFLGERTLWMGGAATKRGEWLIFLANKFYIEESVYIEQSGWFGISSFRPEGMKEQDVAEWRDQIIEWLETFYGFHYRVTN
jgi:hypothetical protein